MSFAHIPLEDELIDVLQKAQRGTGALLTPDELNPPYSIEKLEEIAKRLKLNLTGLQLLAEKAPLSSPANICGVTQLVTPFGETSSNAWVVQIPNSQKAIIIDTGNISQEPAEFLNNFQLEPVAIYLTHTHSDHLKGLKRLHKTWPAVPVYKNEDLINKSPHCHGELKVIPLYTPGHSPDGVTYFLTGLPVPLIFTGDALFSRSMGKATSLQWNNALHSLQNILNNHPKNTLICPGHGFVSTVRQEQLENPFYQSRSF